MSTPGKTPQRRDFSYPQHLSQTRPHTDLLRNFHPTITLPPLPESDTEEEEVEDEVRILIDLLFLSQFHDVCFPCVLTTAAEYSECGPALV